MEFGFHLHRTEDGAYVISCSGTWMPGAYESEEAATVATGYPDSWLQRLQDEANKRAGGSGGTIALDDLRGRR